MLKDWAVWFTALVGFTAITGSIGEVKSIYISKMDQQKVYLGPSTAAAAASKPLFGRFLHFTDMHPDQYYSPGSSVNDACHKQSSLGSEQKSDLLANKKGKKHHKKEKRNGVGYWGAPVSVCDSPKHLIEATLDWLSQNWMVSNTSDMDAGKGLDFIIWTGDTARHDIDATHPRNAKEIFAYNRWALSLVEERFPGIPIVPNFGNNDIIPHNIMFPGPNSMTRAYADIWQKHLSTESQQDTVRKGGFFAKDIIDGDLAVLSLNTLYWYDNNAAVRGCKGKNDPGTLQLDWMEETLTNYRNRRMQVHLIGHVPPTANNYFENCLERYTDMALRYQDTIVGQHFGHMNIDAWYLQHSTSSKKKVQTTAMKSLRPELDDYLAFFVAPSVVPTYLPYVRVWTYNITRPKENQRFVQQASQDTLQNLSMLEAQSSLKKKHRNLPRFTSPDSPSRRNTYLSPLGYSQWVLDLGKANRIYEEEKKNGKAQSKLHYQLEYTTYKASTLWGQYVQVDGTEPQQVPVPKHLLDQELKRLNSNSPTMGNLVHAWFYRLLRLKKHDINVPKKIRHLTRYGLSTCTVDELIEWSRRMVSCKSLFADSTRWLLRKKKKSVKEGYCRMKGGGYQYRNSEAE